MRLEDLLNENITINKIIPTGDKHYHLTQYKEKEKKIDTFDKELKKQLVKQFLEQVKELAEKYKLDVYCVANGEKLEVNHKEENKPQMKISMSRFKNMYNL